MAAVALLGAAGCSEGRDADTQACASVESIDAEVRPILDEGLPAVTEADRLDAATRSTLSQWTYDLADASAVAADDDLRRLVRRAADEAHTAYAGNPQSLSTYDEMVGAVRDRCVELGVAGGAA